LWEAGSPHPNTGRGARNPEPSLVCLTDGGPELASSVLRRFKTGVGSLNPAPRHNPRGEERPTPAMYLAGLPVPPSDVLELARLMDDPDLADRLETAYGRGARILALEVDERITILRALEDGTQTRALAELRAVLLEEHVGRLRNGLA
jgi:hypothetical protein